MLSDNDIAELKKILQPDNRLKTVKKASQETGLSEDFLWNLMKAGKLVRHKVQGTAATMISMAELESITIRIRKP